MNINKQDFVDEVKSNLHNKKMTMNMYKEFNNDIKIVLNPSPKSTNFLYKLYKDFISK
jgi:hypothetical protein